MEMTRETGQENSKTAAANLTGFYVHKRDPQWLIYNPNIEQHWIHKP